MAGEAVVLIPVFITTIKTTNPAQALAPHGGWAFFLIANARQKQNVRAISGRWLGFLGGASFEQYSNVEVNKTMHSIDDLSQHPGLLSAKELAEFLGRSRETVWDWVARGVLSAVKIENKLYFEPAVLAQELSAMRQPKKSRVERC